MKNLFQDDFRTAHLQRPDSRTVHLQRPGSEDEGVTLSPHSGSRDLIHLQQESYQIQIILLTGKTLLLGVQPTFTVRHLSKILELRLAIPSSLLRLLFAGKQLDNNMSLSSYNIERNTTVILFLRLKGGAVGQSSASKGFS